MYDPDFDRFLSLVCGVCFTFALVLLIIVAATSS